MNYKHKNRLTLFISLLIALSLAIFLVLYALKQNINLFLTPTQLLQTPLKTEQLIRLGGYVKKGSVRFDKTGGHVNFSVTDRTNTVPVSFDGLLPNLFREGQGVVINGKYKNSIFIAQEVLAKHDEKYMPKAVKDMLDKEKKNAP